MPISIKEELITRLTIIMARPVHVITNDSEFLTTLVQNGIPEEEILRSKDYTQEEGEHWHYHYHWPVHSSNSLQPTRKTLISRARSNYWKVYQGSSCGFCQNTRTNNFNHACEFCGLYYKIIWLKDSQHHQNTHQYIKDKPLSEGVYTHNTRV